MTTKAVATSSNDMEESLKNIIQNEVFSTKETRKFVSPSGSEMGWNFDFKRECLNPRFLDLFANIFWERYEKKYPFQICGLETGAIPLIAAIVMKSVEKGSPVNGFFIRKSRKKHGGLEVLSGNVTNEKIIIIDDIINTGDSILKQLTVLGNIGKNVGEVVTIVQFREPEYYSFLKERGVLLRPFFTVTDFGLPFEKAEPQKFLGNAFNIMWYFKSENPNYFYAVPKSTPAVDADKLYVGSDNGNFWALNQEDGAIVWKYKVGNTASGKSIFSSPVIWNDTVYFGAYDGNVYALDAQTGKRRWTFFEADWIDSSPVVAEDLGLLFIGLEFGLWKKQGGIVALDLKTGKKKWAHITQKSTHGSPAYSKSKSVVAIGNNDSCAYLYNAKDGKLLWKLQTKGEIKASFAFDEKRNLVLFGSLDGNLYAVNMETGVPTWSFAAEFGIWSTPLVYENNVYFTALDKRLYSVNVETGQLNWKFNTRGRVFASPTMVNSALYIGSNDGRFYEIEPKTGHLTGFFQAAERITNKIAYNEKTKKFFLPTFANEIYCLTRKEMLA